MLLLSALCALTVMLWPRRPRVMAGGSRGVGAARTTAGPDGAAPAGPWSRLRRLWSTEVRFGRAQTGWVAEFAELSAVGLDAGLPSVDAARLACAVGSASSAPMRDLGELIAATEASGGRVGDALHRAAQDHDDLAFLAAAWRLSEELGTASAPAARSTARVLRERSASAGRRAVLAAGPRASMWLLTLLPLSGPLVALLLGLPVTQVYGDGPAGVAAVAGLGATALGWAWSHRLLGRALRPAVLT